MCFTLCLPQSLSGAEQPPDDGSTANRADSGDTRRDDPSVYMARTPA